MVTIDVWRARIGGHNLHCCSSGAKVLCNSDTLLSVTAIHFLVCLTLLIIGNVELNPGPLTFQCSFCQQYFEDLGSHCHHQKIHANVFNYVFECGAPSCYQKYFKFSSLNSHISRDHKESRNLNVSADVLTYVCSYCAGDVENFSSLPKLCHHILNTHVSIDVQVKCPLEGECGRKDPFASKNALSSHLSKHHPGWRVPKPQDTSHIELGTAPQICASTSLNLDDLKPDDSIGDGDGSPDEEFLDAQDSFNYSLEDIFEFISRFYLMLEVDCQLSERTISKICDNRTILSEMNINRLRESIYSELELLKIEKGNIKQILSKISINDVFYLSHHKGTIGPDLTTSHLRKKNFKDSFPQVPVDYPNFVPRDPIDGEKFAYVSLKKSLSSLLQDSSVLRAVRSSFVRNSLSQSGDGNIQSGYMDGEVCKNRNLPARRIDLLIFQDGFSVTSMLSSVQNKHKVMGVYFTIGNLRPWLRTKVKAMHLIMLVLEKHCRKFRQLCWTKLKDELKDLEISGVDLEGSTIPVFIQFFIGDNLGSHFLGGFVEGFTATHFCRYCELSNKEFHRNPNAKKRLRTQQRYELCAETAASSNAKHSFGVKESSVFNELNNFKVCDPGLPPCLGHDLFHGVADWDLISIINALIKKKLFTLELVKRCIASFKYSRCDIKNKLAPLSTSKDKKKKKVGLGGSAVQNWQLLQLLPLIIHDLIKNPEDPLWKLYLLLKRTCEYIYAPKIRLVQIDCLDDLIEKYISERSIVPKEKPKHHFYRHYAELIRKFGPLIHLWAMRFEQKHQFFKKVARTCNDFINILKTLATKCQLLFAYESKGVRFPENMCNFKPVTIESSNFSPSVTAAIYAQNFNDTARATNQILIDGITYKKKSLLLVGAIPSSDNVKVGWIEAIIIDGAQVSFLLRNEQGKFNSSMGIYSIDSSDGFLSFISHDKLPYACPQSVYSINEIDSFSLKHTLL